MISWLKGKIINKWQISNKKGIVLNVSGCGYEIQLLQKHIDETINHDEAELWIHQINREDCTYLYGFIELKQRDLFRKIIGVNGIGPQIGMALLEDYEVSQFAKAIVNNELILLTKTQGVGRRIAERLIVELKNKLQNFIANSDQINNYSNKEEKDKFSEYIDEIYAILKSLGYEDNEIGETIGSITKKEKENHLLFDSLSQDAKAKLMDKHLKDILMLLSEKST